MRDQGTVSADSETDATAEVAARGGVNSVEVAGALLRALAEASGPLRLADLSRATAMPSAKAHRYLVSLARAGLVEQDAATARPGAPTTAAELERLVGAVRALGFAAVANEGDGGLAAVSAPVFDAGG